MAQSKSQSRTPVLEGIREYRRRKIVPFTVPAHKLGKGAPADARRMFGSAYASDMPVLLGVDDRTESKGLQEQAEELAAQAYGADECFFSTNGSSLSVHSALLAIVNPGDTVAVQRNCHRSMVAALVLAHAKVITLEPEVDDDWDVAHGVAPDTLRHALSEHPEIKAVYLVSPDYYGVASDLKALAEICHQHGKPLVVDEAWGPHFPFHPRLPSHAIACGADLAMGSIHKTMNGLGASAVILLKGDRIDRTRFEKAFDLFETTSPPSILLGSIDAARRQMAQQGKSLWSRVFRLSDRVREQLARIEGLRVMGTEVTGTPGAHALDETKIVLDVKGLGVSGFAAGDWLWSEQRVAFELADHRRLMAILSVADDARSAGRLVKAVRALAKWAPRAPSKKRYVELPPERDLALQWVLPPGKAHLGPVRRVKLEKAEGEVAAEMVSPYPPGIPRIVPGTRITRPIVEYFKRGLPAGLFQMDAADEKLETLLVVDQ